MTQASYPLTPAVVVKDADQRLARVRRNILIAVKKQARALDGLLTEPTRDVIHGQTLNVSRRLIA